jgi:hypothetical protein
VRGRRPPSRMGASSSRRGEQGSSSTAAQSAGRAASRLAARRSALACRLHSRQPSAARGRARPHGLRQRPPASDAHSATRPGRQATRPSEAVTSVLLLRDVPTSRLPGSRPTCKRLSFSQLFFTNHCLTGHYICSS